MKNIKMKLLAVLLAAMMLLATACAAPAAQPEATEAPTAAPAETPAPKAEEYTATAAGFGGEVSVTITVQDGALTAVTAKGDSETNGIGSNAIEKLPAAILEAGTFEVDGISGATVSSNAVKLAAKNAMIQAGLIEESAGLSMKPGTYHGEGIGFAKIETIKLDVTVTETEITGITVDLAENAETKPLLETAVNTLIPRMIDNQSISVDSVSGATASSAGIKAAVEAALVQAVDDPASLDALRKPTEKTGGQKELETDVLVIGLGGSGAYAATRAAEAGASVLAIEKQARYGGTTALTSEIYAINPPRIQEEYNEGKDYVDVDAMRASWLEYVGDDAKNSLIEYMMTKSGEAIDWLTYEHDFLFDFLPKNGFTADDVFLVKYQFMPNDISYNKEYIAEYFDGLMEDFTALGGQYLLETEGYDLIEDENGAIVGAKARNLYDGTEYTIHAKSVILATGGFAGNGEMEEKYLAENPYFDLAGQWKCYGTLGNDGKMIQAAIDSGAGTFNIGVAPMVHNAGVVGYLDGFTITEVEGKLGRKTGRPLKWSTADIPLFMASYCGAMTVNRLGERFSNEEKLAHLNSWISGPRYYTLWTQEQVESLVTDGFVFEPGGRFYQYLGYLGDIPVNVPLADALDVVAAAVDAGIILKSDTVEGLAEQMGCDPATLAATVETYNGYCASGVDEQFGKAAEHLLPLSEGPFYAVVGTPVCYSTCGGLDINDDFQVLKADGATPIEGLYSVGTDCIGVLFTERRAYVTFGGAANGWALTSGYLCGDVAAKAALAK